MEERYLGAHFFYNIMPLLQYSWSTPWSSHVLATDACLGGYGVVTAEVGADSVRDIGRMRERRRFKMRGPGARAAALQAFTEEPDSDYEIPEEGAQSLAVDRSFPEVGRPFLFDARWTVHAHGSFVHKEPIHLLEARSHIIGVRCQHGIQDWSGKRVLFYWTT